MSRTPSHSANAVDAGAPRGGASAGSTRTSRIAQALAALPRRRVTITELWRLLDEADPATRLAPDRRTLLLDVVTELSNRGLVDLPAAGSWDRIEKPHLPRFVSLPPHTTAAAPSRRDTIWHPALAWVAEARLPTTHRTDLEKINRWLHTDRSTLVVPVRERSLEIFGHEKTLDRLLRTSLFGPDRLTLDLLRTHRAAPRFTHEVVGPGTTLLVVENSDPFYSFTRALSTDPGAVGIVGWGSGGGFEASVLSIPTLGRRIDRVLYFGDLDLRGLQIPGSASRTATEAGLPPVEPAVGLYEALLAHGQQQTGRRVTQPAAEEAAAWLPPRPRDRVVNLLVEGKRLAQEDIGLRFLTQVPEWRFGLGS